MLSADAHVLYVGKSKNLRARVGSYTSIHPTRSSRKLCRLVHQIGAIRIQETESEAAALRLENELIRRYRPKFNAIATHPESNLFWGIRWAPEDALETRWTRRETDLGDWEAGWAIHGAFRSTSGLAALQALRRLLWWRLAFETRLADWPRSLTLEKVAPHFSQPFPSGSEGKRWRRRFEDWLTSGDPGLLHRLGGKEGVLVARAREPFVRHLLRQDLEALHHFTGFLKRDRAHPFRHAVRQQGFLRQTQLDDMANLRSHSERIVRQTTLFG